MDDRNNEQDTSEVEITDLDEPSLTSSSPRRFRFVPRQYRVPASIGIVGTVVLVILLIWAGTSSPARQLLFPTVSPSPTTPSGSPTYYIQANPPWGYLTLDGHAVQLPPDTGMGAPLVLTSGQHTLVWHAYPFFDQHCMLTAPLETGIDTCDHPMVLPPGESGSVNSIIYFRPSLNLLAAAQRTALIQAAQQALDSEESTEIVRPGEVYALASESTAEPNSVCKLALNAVLCYKATQQPLRATLRFQLDTDTSRNGPCVAEECIVDGQDCRLFCITNFFNEPVTTAPASAWNPLAIVHALWQYSTLDGRIIVSGLADTFIRGMENEHLVSLSITWDGKLWHVTTSNPNTRIPFDDPVCDGAQGDIENLATATQSLHSGFSFNPVRGTTPASGCLIMIAPLSFSDVTPTPTASPVPVAYFLHHFGVLLAVNDAAHRLWPFLPVADAYERQLAQQLIAHQPGT